ncbi:hypothetical protein KL918_001719 [Ogataea parapolymorpha]|nr:hypothetical protein KL918_001719 [Ogataea parapolymorpha]KAG7874319.1 hypothetical protein KL916_001659 [Ogataea parapolymorpha]
MTASSQADGLTTPCFATNLVLTLGKKVLVDRKTLKVHTRHAPRIARVVYELATSFHSNETCQSRQDFAPFLCKQGGYRDAICDSLGWLAVLTLSICQAKPTSDDLHISTPRSKIYQHFFCSPMNAPDRFELFILPDGVPKYVLSLRNLTGQASDHTGLESAELCAHKVRERGPHAGQLIKTRTRQRPTGALCGLQSGTSFVCQLCDEIANRRRLQTSDCS